MEARSAASMTHAKLSLPFGTVKVTSLLQDSVSRSNKANSSAAKVGGVVQVMWVN